MSFTRPFHLALALGAAAGVLALVAPTASSAQGVQPTPTAVGGKPAATTTTATPAAAGTSSTTTGGNNTGGQLAAVVATPGAQMPAVNTALGLVPGGVVPAADAAIPPAPGQMPGQPAVPLAIPPGVPDPSLAQVPGNGRVVSGMDAEPLIGCQPSLECPVLLRTDEGWLVDTGGPGVFLDRFAED